MKLRLSFLLLALVVLVLLLRPSAVWAEMKRLYLQRNYVWGLLAAAVCVYLLYGLYTLYRQGALLP